MKIRWFNLIIGAGLAALCSYGLFIINLNELYKLLCITFAIQFFVTFSILISVSIEDRSVKYNLNTINFIFMVLFIAAAVVFARITPFRQNLFIITQGILSLLYLLVLNSSVQALKKINNKKSKEK